MQSVGVRGGTEFRRSWRYRRHAGPVRAGPIIALLAVNALEGEGFRSPTLGAYGLSSSGGRIAFVDDASAVTHNPANLPLLDRWEASLEPTLAHYTANFNGPGGRSDQTRDPWNVLPNLFVAGPIGEGRFAAGLGITVPYGLGIEWNPDGAFRYSAPYATELRTFNFNPTVAFRVIDGLYLGLGADVMWSELEFQQIYSWSAATGNPGLPDGELDAKGSGVGLGANVGLTWVFLQRHRLAATLRTPLSVDYSGDASLSNVPTLAFGSMTTGFGSRIKYPTIVGFGYGFEPVDCFRFEANAEWLQFSRFDHLPIELEQTPPGIPGGLPQDWNDTFTAGLGATWEFARGFALRAGYQYFQSPVPEYTFSPSIPDAHQNVVTVGVGYRRGRHRFEAAYGHVFYNAREIRSNQNPAFLGNYSMDVHLMSFAYGFSF